MKYEHWRKHDNPDYLGAYALKPDEEPVLTIKSVGYELVTGEGGKKEECRVAHFKENVKPMIVNATNCKTITKLSGTPNIHEWPGVRIQVFAATTKLKGEEVECLRIRPKAPVINKPVLDTNYKGWDAALASVTNGETTVDYLETKYTIPTDCKKIMLEAAHA